MTQPGENSPQDSPDKNTPERGPDKDAKKPRGMGGVFIIMLLLLALILIVSRSADQSRGTPYDFWWRLYNARFSKILLGPDSSVTAQYENADGQMRKFQTNFKQLTPDQQQTIQDLQAVKLDRSLYESRGIAGLIDDIEDGSTQVVKAWVIDQTAPHKLSTEAPQQTGTEPMRQQQSYVTAIVVRGSGTKYVKIPSSDRLAGLLAILKQREVPVQIVPLAPDARFEIEKVDQWTIYFLSTIGPWILIIALFWFFIIRQMRSPGGTGGVLSFGRSRVHRYNKEQRTQVTFDDVEGMDEAKEEVREVIEFLKNRSKFQRLGGRIPRGILLVGPPGTGKTLLAKAIAGEADVPFFSISGSDFVEMFVGVGASRVRDLFKQARESAPCIVFLDEIDAVGRKRGTGMGGGHDEREQTLNAILVEMDGFDTDEGIILIGATNRPDVLDPALLRPGRFDRQVVIDMPDVQGREAILRVHARKIKMAKSVDFDKLARATPGFSGAELASLINEAAILAGMRGEESVTMQNLEEARDRVRWGREKRSRRMEEEDRRVTAYHEAGHALVGAHIPEVDPVHKVTIIARGQALGATMYLPEKDDYHMRRSKLVGMIAMSFGGRIAEEIVFDDVSAGAANDIMQATRIARMMVAEWGMSDLVGPINYSAPAENNFLGRDFAYGNDHSEETQNLIDAEVKKIVDEGYHRAKTILVEERGVLDRLAEALLRYETISGEEVKEIVAGAAVESLRPANEPHIPPGGLTADSKRPRDEKESRREDDLGFSGASGLAPSS